MTRKPTLRDRAFRMLLRLLPEDFRAAYARDMEVTFRDELRDAAASGRPSAAVRTWVATAGQILRIAPAEHAHVLAGDVRFALRTMAARPAHTVAAILTLAIGIGVNVAMFGVIDAVLLAPLPYGDPDRLVSVGETGPEGKPGPTGYLSFVDLRAMARSFDGLAAASQSTATLTGGGRDAERVNAMRVSRAYFDMIGVQPVIGRSFLEAEDRPGAARRVAILAHALWQRRFDRDPSVVGKIVDVSGIPIRIVGVMPAGFNDLIAARMYGDAEIWFPLGYDPSASFACRTCRHLRVFGRLAPGVTPERAGADVAAIFATLERQHPTEYHAAGGRVTPLRDVFLGPTRRVLTVLWAAVGLLLVVACSNVASLQLLRATERAREMAIRAALGVTRRRLTRQLLTEVIVLSGIAAVVGIVPAWIVLRVIATVDLPALPRLDTVAIHAREVTFAVGTALIAGIAVGLVPLRQLLGRRNLAMLHGAGSRTDAPRTWRIRSVLVGANVAMAAMLLVGSGLLVRSLANLLAVSPGVDAGGVASLQVFASGPRFRDGDDAQQLAAAVRFYEDVLTRVRALPGVVSASAVTTLPLGGNIDRFGLHVQGRPESNPSAAPSGDRFVVARDFFETLRIPLVRGRLLNADDRQGSEPVMVINRAMAAGMFPNEDPIGHRVSVGLAQAPPRLIVGIVGDVRHSGLDAPAGYQFYVPHSQWAWAETFLTLVVRTDGDPARVIAPVRDAVRQVDPAQPVTNAKPYGDVIAASIGTRRFAAWLLGGFAGAALMLAIVGLYGAVGVSVGQRRGEIAVRLALGARASGILRMVLAQGLRPVLIGLGAGLAGAALSAQAMRSLLHQVDALDPPTFAGVAAVLVTCAVIACYVPARRAGRIDAAASLRQ